MIKYILKRIFLFSIPTLIAVSILIFLLANLNPYDPCQDKLEGSAVDQYSCQLKIKRFHLDKPSFYFKVSTQAYPDTLYQITNKYHRNTLNHLIDQYGNWEAIETYYYSLVDIDKKIVNGITKNSSDTLFKALNEIFPPMLLEHDDEEILTNFKIIKEQFKENTTRTALLQAVQKAEKNYENIKSTATPNKRYLPAFHFYGLDNQYHIWVSNFIRGDFGKSFVNELPVIDMIKEKLPITLMFSTISIILIYLISIQLGVRTAARKGTKFDARVKTGLFMLHSIPSFWVAMMMMIFLTRPQFLDLFPSGGLPNTDRIIYPSFIHAALDYVYHMILPIICWTYPSLAYLSHQMRGGMLTVMEEDYIRTAKAKGVSPKDVLWKHTYKNALIPIATMFGNVFPKLIAGSIVLEVIFDLEGMGLLFFDAIGKHNHPLVFSIVMLIAILTVIGYLISDILYKIIDPRIELSDN